MSGLPQQVTRFARRYLIAIAALTMTGCAAPGRPHPPRLNEAVRFPEPPDDPRVIFLTTLEDAIGEVSDQTPLEQFLFGRVDATSSSMVTPFGIDVRDGLVLVSDTQQEFVHGFDLINGTRFKLGTRGEGRTREPVDVAIAADGTRLVADSGRNQVLVFDSANRYVGTVGGPTATGWTDAQDAFKPISVAAAGDHLAVVNGALKRVELYRISDGALIKVVTEGHGEAGGFLTPTGVTFDSQGRLYAVDAVAARAHLFDADGNPRLSFGKPGATLGRLARPRRLGVGPDGVIYIADALFHHVHMFNQEGRMLMYVGGAGQSPGCTNEVADVCCDTSLLSHFSPWIPSDFKAEYLLFVTSQLGPGRVNIYAFGEKRLPAAP